MVGLPFTEDDLGGGVYERTFREDTPEDELVWHRDREDRIVAPAHDTDWMLQMDNELPMRMQEAVYIPAGLYHRIIRGTGSLTVRVKKILEK